MADATFAYWKGTSPIRGLPSNQSTTGFEIWRYRKPPITLRIAVILAADLRATIPVTSNAMRFGVELWRANVMGARIEDLSGLFIDGTIDMNIDRVIMLNLQVRLRNPGAVQPFSDFLLPIVTIAWEDGRPNERYQLGLYPVRMMTAGEFTVNKAIGQFACDDMVSIAINAIAQTAIFEESTDLVGTSVSHRLFEAGIGKRAIPSGSATFGTDQSRPVGSSMGAVANDWLAMIGWYALHMRLDGYVTTAGAYRDLNQIEPSLMLTDTDLLTSLSPVATDNQIVNIGVVTTDTSILPPKSAIARNDDALSPASTVNIGDRARTEVLTGNPSQAALDKRARQIVQDGRRFYRTVSVVIQPRPQLLEPRQTIRLNLTGEQAGLSGIWYVRTARMGLTPETSAMTLELNQTVDFNGNVI